MIEHGQSAKRVRSKQGFLGAQSIIRIIEEVERQIDVDAANQLLSEARFDRIPAWDEPVPEGRVAALHQAIRRRHPEAAERICRNAGRATTDYLLSNRIPVRAQELLIKAPPAVAMWLVTRSAMVNARHFGGSGEFIIQTSTVFDLRFNPVLLGETAASPVCHYHAAAFERMYQRLVDPEMICRETACEAMGDDACRFEVSRPAGDVAATSCMIIGLFLEQFRFSAMPFLKHFDVAKVVQRLDVGFIRPEATGIEGNSSQSGKS